MAPALGPFPRRCDDGRDLDHARAAALERTQVSGRGRRSRRGTRPRPTRPWRRLRRPRRLAVTSCQPCSRPRAPAALRERSSRPPTGVGRLPRAAVVLMSAMADSRRLRIVVAKPGLDGHDRGAEIIARALRDAGMEVVYTGFIRPRSRSPKPRSRGRRRGRPLDPFRCAHDARASHRRAAARAGCRRRARHRRGTIPQGDVAALKNLGVAEAFAPGTATNSIVAFMRDGPTNVPRVSARAVDLTRSRAYPVLGPRSDY
jgi:methylmalonyl-CoA mutase cobalamin-binding subunit